MYTTQYMLFNPRNKKVFRAIFGVLSVLIILSMLAVYLPNLR
jgi:hypothetical protein